MPLVPPCRQAAEALAQMGPAAQEAVPALTAALSNPQLFFFRPAFALALGKIDRRAASIAVPALIDVLAGKRRALPDRKEAASVLGQIGGETPDAIAALAKALGDADAAVRQEAAKALGAIGPQARSTVPPLRKALMDPDDAVRSEAVVALKRIGA